MLTKSISLNERKKLFKQNPMVIWFTGLSGSGKTTLSDALEKELFILGFKTYILDGDKIRDGLCKDLGFSEEDRTENIRRVGEVAKLMMNSGLIILAAFITPFEKDRQMLREMIGSDNFIQVFVDCPLVICEQRDVKGLYKKARLGEVKRFTGISSPFEVPLKSDLILKTNEKEKEALLDTLTDFILPRISLNNS